MRKLSRLVGIAFSLTACVPTAQDRELFNADRIAALKRYASTPQLRVEIARAVVESQMPYNPLDIERKVVKSLISHGPSVGENYGVGPVRTFYCVQFEIEQPIMNLRRTVAVYPEYQPDGMMKFNMSFKPNGTEVTECRSNVSYSLYPELTQAVLAKNPSSQRVAGDVH